MAGAGKHQHRKTGGSHMRVGVPRGTAEHPDNIRSVLQWATARAAGRIPVIAGRRVLVIVAGPQAVRWHGRGPVVPLPVRYCSRAVTRQLSLMSDTG